MEVVMTSADRSILSLLKIMHSTPKKYSVFKKNTPQAVKEQNHKWKDYEPKSVVFSDSNNFFSPVQYDDEELEEVTFGLITKFKLTF